MKTKTEIILICNFHSTYDSCCGQCEKCPNCRKEKEVNDEK